MFATPRANFTPLGPQCPGENVNNPILPLPLPPLETFLRLRTVRALRHNLISLQYILRLPTQPITPSWINIVLTYIEQNLK